jgi:hypothetical protein
VPARSSAARGWLASAESCGRRFGWTGCECERLLGEERLWRLATARRGDGTGRLGPAAAAGLPLRHSPQSVGGRCGLLLCCTNLCGREPPAAAAMWEEKDRQSSLSGFGLVRGGPGGQSVGVGEVSQWAYFFFAIFRNKSVFTIVVKPTGDLACLRG